MGRGDDLQGALLQAPCNLSDDQAEHQIRDRLSFSRFLGLGLQARVPDAKALWLYRQALVETRLLEKLFKIRHVSAHPWLRGERRTDLDATIVPTPRQRNTAAENDALAEGEVPAGWQVQAPVVIVRST